MLIFIMQISVFCALAMCSIFIGVADLPVQDIIALESEKLDVLTISRIPRLCSIVAAGASLSVAGLIMQRITKNKFVSPTTAGTMEWCKLGVIFAIICMPEAGSMARLAGAFTVSLAGTFIFMAVVNKVKSRNIVIVPLIGIMLGGVVGAASTFFAYKYDIIQNTASWLQGNFSLVIAGKYELLYLGIPIMAIAFLYADRFTIASMGKNTATSLGLSYRGIVNAGITIVTLVSSITVVCVGNIPFVGLIVPNIVSIFKGDSVKDILWDTAWFGSVLVLFCDILGRTIIFPYEIPIGVILSIIGSFTFLALILKGKKHA